MVAQVSAAVAALALVLAGIPHAEADSLFGGVCELDLTFTFDGGVSVSGPFPSYSISIDGNSSGCDLTTALTPTSTDGGGSAPEETSFVHCGVLAGIGTWGQGWPGLELIVNNGTHVVSGSWLGATMALSGFDGNSVERFNAVVLLTPHPNELFMNAMKMATCANGGTVSSIRMLGVQVFVDPVDEEDLQL